MGKLKITGVTFRRPPTPSCRAAEGFSADGVPPDQAEDFKVGEHVITAGHSIEVRSDSRNDGCQVFEDDRLAGGRRILHGLV